MRRVESHDIADRPARGKEGREPTIGEDALDEVLAQPGVVEPALLFDREQGKARHQRLGEQSASGPSRHAARRIYLDSFETAGGGILLQHETKQLVIGEFRDPAASVTMHHVRLIVEGPGGQQASLVAHLHESHRLAWRVHPRLDFRAHGNPVDELAERFHEKGISLVAAVEAHTLPEQTGRNPEPYSLYAHPRSPLAAMLVIHVAVNRGHAVTACSCRPRASAPTAPPCCRRDRGSRRTCRSPPTRVP